MRRPLPIALLARLLAAATVLFAVSLCAASCGQQTEAEPRTPSAGNEPPASAVIGVQGGSVFAPSGSGVTVPAGALDGDKTITVTPAPPSAGPSGAALVGPQYALGPDGTTFAKPVTVKFAFDPSRLPVGKTAADVKIYTAPSGSTAFTWLPTTLVDSTHVSAAVLHFSDDGPGIPNAGPPPKKAPGKVNSNANIKMPPKEYEPVVPPFSLNGTFCDEYEMATDLAPHPLSRRGRVTYDAQCSRHKNIMCVTSGVNVMSREPEGCVDVQVTGGQPEAPVADPRNNLLQCVECPTVQGANLLPNNGQAACDAEEIQIGHSEKVIFNINGFDVEWMKTTGFPTAQKEFNKQQKAGTATGQSVDESYLWKNPLERMFRTLALELNYCGDRAWGVPSPYPLPNPPGGVWKFADPDHRPDLITYLDLQNTIATVNVDPTATAKKGGGGGTASPGCTEPASPSAPSAGSGAPSSTAAQAKLPTTVVESSPMATNPPEPPDFPHVTLELHYSAFTDADAPDHFDFEGLATEIIHEMRHMATPNWGAGNKLDGPLPRSAEHYLNELEDYEEMFNHPFFIGVPEQTVNRLRGQFNAGRDTEYVCFQATWGSAGGSPSSPVPGYPEDTGQAPVNIAMPVGLPGLGGMGGMMMPMGMMGGAFGRATHRQPMSFSPVPPSRRGACFLNGVQPDAQCQIPKLTTPADRCTVANWARENRWMESKMVRSAMPQADSPSEWQGQPWNTLANYVLMLPFRTQPYKPCVQARP